VSKLNGAGLAKYLRRMAKTKKVDWALAPAPESKDHIKINEQYEHFIGGDWQKPKSGMTSR